MRHAAALVFIALSVAGCANRFSCWDGQRSLAESDYEYFAGDNTLKECENPLGNGFQLGTGMIMADRLYTLRSCEEDSPQTCIDKEQVVLQDKYAMAMAGMGSAPASPAAVDATGQSQAAPALFNPNAPAIYDSNGSYLGNLDQDRLDPNSVYNPMSPYGNPLAPNSVTNPLNQYRYFGTLPSAP